MHTLIQAFTLGLFLLAPVHADEPHGHHHPDHRMGSHGMLVFGTEGEYFLSHIPMFQEPHNAQLVLKVKLSRDGEPLTGDFSEAAFSLAPATHFSLDNLALGKLTHFEGELFTGSFEAGGSSLMKSVEVEVESVLAARNLPGTPLLADKSFVYYLVQGKKNAYLLNYITAKHPWQSIVKLAFPHAPLGDGVWLVRASQRLQGKHCLPVQGIDDQGKGSLFWFRANTTKELWCLKGPGFFHPCD